MALQIPEVVQAAGVPVVILNMQVQVVLEL
jgi:hypothetical protein